MVYRKLVLSGGGIKGISFVGAIKILNLYGILDTIDTYVGCSAGAIISLFLSIGYQHYELYQLFTKINFFDYQEINVENFLTKKGMDSGNKLMRLFEAITKRKGVSFETTFIDLYQKTSKELIIGGSNITTNRVRYFSYKNTPNVSVLQALRISISYPFIFEPVEFENHIYIDGALLDPFPIKYFGENCQDVIGILIHDRLLIEDRDNCNDSLEDLGLSIVSAVVDKLLELSLKGMEGQFIQIDIKNMNSMDFQKGDLEKQLIYEKGLENTKIFFANKFKLCYHQYLMKKYFQLWKEKTMQQTNKPIKSSKNKHNAKTKDKTKTKPHIKIRTPTLAKSD